MAPGGQGFKLKSYYVDHIEKCSIGCAEELVSGVTEALQTRSNRVFNIYTQNRGN
jgi:hypothetical protein